MAGHRQSGLIGIKERGGIPECYGMHGIYDSGGLNTSTSPQWKPSLFPQKSSDRRQQLAIETGGIKVYRPMLGFSKARLIATCQYENMEWFEDYTNKDTTLTKRNAIRHMYNSHIMPTALAKPALLGLSQRVQESVLREDRIVDFLVAKCNVKEFNTRAGTLTLHFPDMEDICTVSNGQVPDFRRIAAKILRRILFLITPLEHIDLASLHNAVTQIFRLPDSVQLLYPQKAFTAASVYFQPLNLNILRQQRGAHKIEEPEIGRENQVQWLLSRQPYTSGVSKAPIISIPPSEDVVWTPWTLYDGRYWIRVQNLSSHMTIDVRPFSPHELKHFQRSLSPENRRTLLKMLKEEVSGGMRWTLPAVSFRGQPEGRDLGENLVVALPTLGFHIQSAETVVKWEIRYKKVDLTGLLIDTPAVQMHNET
ncbi:hypothetical protein EG329_010358 [Mollisiaceae sp. DMI_Dod_QoI]|nr:hypothetical protein EG329_010358 [Helotiales sp. DMI_Dod_QoI]